MKEKKIFDAITNIEDELVEEAAAYKFKKKMKWKNIITIAACAAIIISAALILPKTGNNIADNSNEVQLQSSSTPKPTNVNLTSPLSKVHAPTSTNFLDNPVDEQFYTSLEDFSAKTTAQLAKSTEGNMVFSPLSLYYALAITATGAEGETADEMLELLGVSDKEYLSQQSHNLYNILYADDITKEFKISNSIWLDYNYNLKESFAQNTADKFYAEVYHADYNSKETADTMSKWVYENTGGLIKPEFEFSGNEVLSIFNTVYLRDEWQYDFDEKLTKLDKFHLKDGSEIDVDFMNKKSIQSYVVGDNYISADMLMKDGFYMRFILPDEGINPRDFLSSPEKLKELLWYNPEEYYNQGKLLSGEVTWKVPKFDIYSKMDLKDTLLSLGMEKAFSDADFSGITDSDVSIGDIKQETRIKVHEKGVEAAAFTREILCGGAPVELINTEIILDRPFIFAIRKTDEVSFIGICENPLK